MSESVSCEANAGEVQNFIAMVRRLLPPLELVDESDPYPLREATERFEVDNKKIYLGEHTSPSGHEVWMEITTIGSIDPDGVECKKEFIVDMDTLEVEAYEETGVFNDPIDHRRMDESEFSQRVNSFFTNYELAEALGLTIFTQESYAEAIILLQAIKS